jgi:hypothetical protein
MQSIISFLGFFPDVIVLIMCITYMSKKRTTDSVLLFIGSATHVLIRLFYLVIPYLSMVSDSGTDSLMGFYTIGSFASLISSIIFCAGIVMLISRVLSMA